MSESDRSTVRREGTGLVAEYKFFFFEGAGYRSWKDGGSWDG